MMSVVTYYLNQTIESQTVPANEAVATLQKIAAQNEYDIFVNGRKVKPETLTLAMLTTKMPNGNDPWIDLQPGLVGG
jgi:hypothetical protein